jgi:hypothetical protein
VNSLRSGSVHHAQLLARTFDPNGPNSGNPGQLLEILAWCASAAGVFGVICVGINMALQLSRGAPGEGAEHLRGLTIIMVACVLATTAGPLVAWLGPMGL